MEEYVAYSSRASLVALGFKFQYWQLWSPIRNLVEIKQKGLKHTSPDKLLDYFINILAGGMGVVKVHTRVHPDQPVQRAFGRPTCAEQSTVSDTLNACTSENVQQLRHWTKDLANGPPEQVCHRIPSLGGIVITI